MIEGSGAAPIPDGAGVVMIPSRMGRIADIQSGLLTGYRAVPFPQPRLSLSGPPLPDEELQIALRSARKPKRGALGRWAKPRFLKGQFNWCWHRLGGVQAKAALCWNGSKGHRRLFMRAAQERGMTPVYLEHAPLPKRVSVDFQGINFGNSLPRRAEVYERWLTQSGYAPEAWRATGADLVARPSATRDDVAQAAAPDDLGETPYLFVPLQVPGDSQLTLYGDWLPTIDAVIDALCAVAERLPDGWHLRVKEHPTARVSFAEALAAAQTDKLRVDNQTDTFAQVAASRGVVTVNSSVGLQSFYHDKPVVVLGQAFYAFDGIATRASSLDALGRILASPTALGFDQRQRDAFMTYLDKVHFPTEDACISGQFTLANAQARDQALRAFL